MPALQTVVSFPTFTTGGAVIVIRTVSVDEGQGPLPVVVKNKVVAPVANSAAVGI